MSTVYDLLPSAPFRADHYVAEWQRKRSFQNGEVPFKAVLAAFRHYLGKEVDGNEKEDATFLRRKYNAIAGEESAKQYFIHKIYDFLREYPHFQNTQYPDYYPDLAEAIFQDHLGYGPMSVWFANPTESATVNDTAILFGVKGKDTKDLQPFRFDSIDQVKKLIRTLTLKESGNQINQANNWTQVDMTNGTRVTIFAPPLSESYVLVFRQYLFKDYRFEQVARMRTIPLESVMWWKWLSRLMLNTITTGIRRSGKTTFLKVIFAAREEDLEVVTVERGSFEAHLKRDFPNRAERINAIKSPLDEMASTFPAFLRADAHYMIVPEVRSEEVILLFLSRERGNGYLASYHSPHVLNIPAELADLALEQHPNRDYLATYTRAAQSLDIAITMRETKMGRKIVTGVYAYEFDHESASFSVTTWMKYKRESDAWLFHAEMPPLMKERLEEEYPDELARFLVEFERLERAYPLTDAPTKMVRVGGRMR